MLVLIAESKTMTACDSPVTPESYKSHSPAGENRADEIMSGISALSPREIADRGSLSLSMAIKLHRQALEFPDKSNGQLAIEAFTGVVFKAIDYKSLTDCARSSLCRDVRIISSLYGWLKPDDIIKAYRMDYTSRLSPLDNAMYTYWRDSVSASLVQELHTTGTKAVLNLLPGDAAKCVDWNMIKRFAVVWTVDFKEIKEGGKFVTPNAGLLKKLRGHLLREIIERRIDNPEDLLALKTSQLLPMGETEISGHIAFCM